MADENKADLLAACRSALRIPADYTGYDEEIADLVSAARSALVAGGVSDAKANSDDDASVRVAVKTYVKANFGMDNPDADRLMRSFGEMLCRMPEAPSMAARPKRARNEYVGWHVPACHRDADARQARRCVNFACVPGRSVQRLQHQRGSLLRRQRGGHQAASGNRVEGVRLSRRNAGEVQRRVACR